MKWYGSIIILFIVITIMVIFPSEKKRIKKIISLCEQAVIDEDVKALMGHVSFNYSDEYGGSYLMLKKRAKRLFSVYDNFEVTTDLIGIDISDDNAEADLKVSLIVSTGIERGYLLGDAGSHRELKVYLEKSTSGWSVIKLVGLGEKEQDLQLY